MSTDGPCTFAEADEDDSDRYPTRPDCTSTPATTGAACTPECRAVVECHDRERKRALGESDRALMLLEVATKYRKGAEAEVERLTSMGTRWEEMCNALTAELMGKAAEVERLRSGIEALAEHWLSIAPPGRSTSTQMIRQAANAARALLAPSEAPSSPGDATNPPEGTCVGPDPSEGARAVESAKEPTDG